MTGRPAVRLLLLGAALCLAPACNPALQSHSQVAAAVQRPALEYYHWLRAASGRALEQEQQRLEQAHPAMDPVVRTVCLAMLLSLPGRPADDGRRALALLRPLAETGEYAADSQAYDYLRLGLMWRDMLEERQRLLAGAAQAGVEQARNERQARELQEELSALRQQIEALKSIEQQINQRQRPASSP